MPTVTFILGLCGSGKSWLLNEHLAAHKGPHDGFLSDPKHVSKLRVALLAGQDAAVVEIALCRFDAREQLLAQIADIPNLHVRWICFENDLERANKNCSERRGHSGDPEEHLRINAWLSPLYSYPEGAEVLKIWSRDSAQ